MCPSGQEGQWHPGLHLKGCGYQVESSFSTPPCPGEAASEILCTVLAPQFKDR